MDIFKVLARGHCRKNPPLATQIRRGINPKIQYKSETPTPAVGRRGTNQLRLLERYLDVLVKHTTEIPPPTALVEGTTPSALVEGVSLRWFILSCEYLISWNQIHAHTCYQSHRGNGSQNPKWLSDFLQRLSNFPQRLSKILNSFLLSEKSDQGNLFTGRSIQKITIWALYFLPLAFPLALRAL